MIHIKLLSIALTGLIIADTGPDRLLAQPRAEIRDPVRGVSFHSVELSDVPVNSMEVVEGVFPDSDRLTIGASALVLDGSADVDEYILWLRHEGRRWFNLAVDDPVVVEVDGEPMPLEQLRASQPFVGDSSRLFEKIEFRLGPNELERLVDGQTVRIRLRSPDGVVEKLLTPTELDHLRVFRASLKVG